MTNKKAVVGIPLALIVAIAGGSYALDFSTTTTTTISDDDTTITNLDIDVNDLREICDSGIVPEKYQGACDVLGLIP